VRKTLNGERPATGDFQIRGKTLDSFQRILGPPNFFYVEAQRQHKTTSEKKEKQNLESQARKKNILPQPAIEEQKEGLHFN